MTQAPIARQLLSWYDRHGRKTLPWQKNKTPYRVWVSEIMLQQTQVATVIPYFERFMTAFPSINALATAKADDVLHLWAGLGYYSRARNLHKTAEIIAKEHGGEFPDTLEAITALPGIGTSTAGAILSIAFQIPTPILDGNVKRVLTRLHGISDPVNDKATDRKLWELATQHTPKKRVAEYTQAIMDLGATLCTRRQPECGRCPFVGSCIAYATAQTETIPAKKNTKKIPTKAATFLIIKKGRKVLLQKRPAKGIWGGLFSLPELKGDSDTATIKAYCQKTLKLALQNVKKLTEFRHTFSHYHLQIQPVIVNIKQVTSRIMEDNAEIWYNLDNPGKVGLPKPIQAILRELT